MKNYNPTLLEESLGALSIAACIVSSPLSRGWYSSWGATPDEVKMTLPGDDIVPAPKLESTRAITIDAPVSEVWPWVVQLGQGRGGFYSYQSLENLAGCKIVNADQIIPEFQSVEIGDKVRLGPDGYPAFDVADVMPEVALILQGDIQDAQENITTWIWIFYLHPINEHVTRLILRTRLTYADSVGNSLMWRVFTDPISFNMERKMLQGIKSRVETQSKN